MSELEGELCAEALGPGLLEEKMRMRSGESREGDATKRGAGCRMD